MSSMGWHPEMEPLRVLSECLRDSLSGNDKNAQKVAETMLQKAKSSPDINNYLTYLFTSSEPPAGLSYSTEEFYIIRAAAATMLKNNIKENYKNIPPESLALIRASIPLGLQDRNYLIRNYAGNVITEIVTKGGVLGWPQIIPELLAMIGNDNGNITPGAQEGAIAALAKICEDNKRPLDRDYQGQRPLTVIIPRLISFTRIYNPKIRSIALSTINIFLLQASQTLIESLDELLQCLFQLSADESADVRRHVCRTFVHIVEIRPEKILPHISGLVDYMIEQQRNANDEDLACDAAEFWLTIGEQPEIVKTLAPYLGKVIPVLLESMVYTKDDIAMLRSRGDDADEEDNAEDIKPKFARSKSLKNNSNNSDYRDGGEDDDKDFKKNSMRDEYYFEEGEIDDEDDDDDDDEQTPEDRWNLRKCSAAALDVFASDFQAPVFEKILPYLMSNLKHNEWPFREAAVLALGAVAEGCMDVVTPHLPELVPYLISLLDDPEPLVRQITCWTLGRYSSWAASLNTPVLRSQYFEPMMEGILTKMLDRNKRVQEAGASAFAHLEEKAGSKIIPYCQPIIQQFVRCFESYKDRNMFILYDCVQTLAENVGRGLSQPHLVEILMPALIRRWNQISDQSRELFPLFECLSYVVTALAESFAPFARPVFQRCIKIVHENLEESLAARNNSKLDLPDKDFLVTSLDLLSAIIQALDSQQSASLVSESQPAIFDLLKFCMVDPENDVRQSSYALLGDCSKYVFPQLQPCLEKLLPIIIRQLDLDAILDEQIETEFSVVNNTCWSAGEVAIQYGKGMAPYVPKLLERYLQILGNPEVPKSVLENAAIALGRLGLENSDLMAPHLTTIAEPFLKCIATVDYTIEKATAFKGFCHIVITNPQAMEKDLPRFFSAIAKYKISESLEISQTADLKQIIQHIIDLYKSLIPNFNTYISGQIPADHINKLHSTYNL
ncbi:Importin subunit beta-2 [Golovinomyces cichoracearum]|uniref:Importin subunit beta-2 n=1 Tax=Golovinomyces cichoracearum TaxID=62708 RepID=A0A420JA78_9PEZI|nr:Importin subunit beta-2 [Golovinomyces cichoracearum]